MFASLFVLILGCCCCKESSQSFLDVPKLFGPLTALVGDIVEFTCELLIYPKNESILLQLYKEGNRDKLLGEYTSRDGNIAVFPTVIKPYHEGNLECEAKAQNNSAIQATVSKTHYLEVIEPVTGAEIEVRSGPLTFFEGKMLELHCKLSSGNHVSFKWLFNGRFISQSPLHDLFVISKTTPKDSGSYICVATNQFNETKVFISNSSEVVITVKDVVSNPDISFTVLKDDSHNYSAMVTCQSSFGTPPVTFSLYNKTELVANATVEEGNAIFKVPLVLDLHLGWLQCQANNGDQTAYSTWIPLEVVSVGGPVMLDYDYDVGENYAAIGLRLYCKAAKGSHPQYQWFLNKTLLHARGSFYYVVHQPPEQSILLLSVGRSSAGTYHCEVSDSFDNSSTITSKSWYLDKEGLNRLPLLVVVVVFGCFMVLVVLVSICCWFGVVFRRKKHGQKPLSDYEMERMAAAYESELDLSDFSEDGDVVKATRLGEFDQSSEASADG